MTSRTPATRSFGGSGAPPTHRMMCSLGGYYASSTAACSFAAFGRPPDVPPLHKRDQHRQVTRSRPAGYRRKLITFVKVRRGGGAPGGGGRTQRPPRGGRPAERG